MTLALLPLATLYRFHGAAGKYQIANGTLVTLVKTWAKRKCLIRLEDGTEHISMVSLLRRVR